MSRFDAHRAAHQPIVSSLHTPRVEGFCLREASAPGGPLLDHATLTPQSDGRIRMTAVDPAIGPDPLDALPGAHAVLAALVGPDPATACLRAANTAVHAPGRTRADGVARFCAVAVDWDVSAGVVHAVRAGDCETWVRVAGQWHPVLPGDMLHPHARERWTQLAPAQDDRTAHLRAHATLLGEPGDWAFPPLGEFADLGDIRTETWHGVDAVAVCTDGVQATGAMFDDVADWLARLHDRPDDWPHLQPHGDLALAIAWRRGATPVPCPRPA